MITCWLCSKQTNIKETDYGEHRCNLCNVLIDVLNPQQPPDWSSDNQATTEEEWLNEEEGESAMGKLSDIAKQRSPFIRIAIGEKSEPMIYKGWKEISGQFGDSFRYLFEVNTEKGLVQKSFDCPQQKFAEAMDLISFGATVIIHRKQKVDANANSIEGKSIYTVEEVRE